MSLPNPPWAIHADGVCYAYPGGVRALADLTFSAAPGEIVAVTGPNGAGKTTLLRLLARLIRPQHGQVRLAGRDIAELGAAELYSRLGIVFQNPSDQLFANTVAEDVACGPRNLGLAEDEVQRRVEESLEAVDALGLEDRPVHRLSFGQQKRVSLAGVLAMQPEVLLLDEPLAGLDHSGEARMMELLLEINRRRQTTLILSTHSVDILPAVARRIYVLVAGRVLREGTPREVFGDAALLEQAGLRVPLVSQVFQGLDGRARLGDGELPLTVAEGRQQIERWLGAFVVPSRGGIPPEGGTTNGQGESP